MLRFLSGFLKVSTSLTGFDVFIAVYHFMLMASYIGDSGGEGV